MDADLLDAERDKSQRQTFQRLDDPPEYSSKFSCWEIQKKSEKNAEFMHQLFGKKEPSSSFLFLCLTNVKIN